MSAIPTQRPTIVLVDDSVEVRDLVRLMLQSSGFDVVGECGDGDEAIMLAYRLEPDLVLLDTSMPRCDGVEALPAIRALSPHTQVVVFTGFDEPALNAHMRELGAADFIEKSVPLDVLRDRLLAVHARAADAPAAPAAPSPLRLAVDLPGQQVLAEHVAEFRELFDRAQIGMATLTTSGTIVRANRALAGLMSCEPTDLVGVEYGRLAAGKGDELDDALDAILHHGADLTSFEHDAPGSAPRLLRVTLSAIRGANREVLYAFAQVQDVTSQRQAEARLLRSEESFRRLVTAVREYAIFRLDTEGRVETWNLGAQRIKGYDEEEILHRHFRVFYLEEDRHAGRPEHNLELALRDGSYAEEGWRVRKDGTRFWASVVITAVYDDAGNHVGFAKVTRDQTVQREHEEERQRAIDERIHILAVTAHELRSPTMLIDGSAAALQAGWGELTPAERDRRLVAIRTSAERLRRLAADLSSAARAETESLPIAFDNVSLRGTLEDAAARNRAIHPGTPITVDCPDDAVFYADAERVAQALDNLVDNAVRHGGGPVLLAGRTDGVVRISVSDEGSEIAAEVAEHLFEPYASGGPTGGTGLGLHLVREIARRHGGDAVYHPPADDSAARFEIVLPRQG